MRLFLLLFLMRIWIRILILLDTLLFWVTTPLRTWRRRQFRRDWGKLDRALELSFEALQSDPSAEINDEYCWMHQPGGWTCPICRQAQEQETQI
ncbi:hypothetical protein [Dictyobacter kobayashii]|uniref:hypothetical protein n=1 Tax=Dictyobacter kobayashii TaxID=2014872 RepID=UPI000F8307CB|nr:hypothetical protein [Dictyobacter kobayashii]